jgi:hypothetical protein
MRRGWCAHSTTIAGRTRATYSGSVPRALGLVRCCLHPKVLIGIALVGVAILLLAPDLVSRAFPVLLALVCPLSMLLMLRSMGTMGGTQASGPGPMASPRPTASEAAVSPDARLALLRARLQVLEDQKRAVAAEIATLEAAAARAPSRAPGAGEEVGRVAG